MSKVEVKKEIDSVVVEVYSQKYGKLYPKQQDKSTGK